MKFPKPQPQRRKRSERMYVRSIEARGRCDTQPVTGYIRDVDPFNMSGNETVVPSTGGALFASLAFEEL